MLPRELRDEIYKLLCSDTYYSISKHLKMKIGGRHRPWSSRHLSDLKMTGLSKCIRQEYLAILHAEAIFSAQKSNFYKLEGLTRDDIPFVDQVQKVEILEYPDEGVLSDQLCYREGEDIRETNEELFKKGAEPFSLFIGTGIPRKTCVVRLIISMPKAILLIHSPFFDAIRRLTDFKTVTLEIDSFRNDHHLTCDVWTYDCDLHYVGGDSSQMDHAGAVNVIAESMKGALEPSLGPSTLREERLEKLIHPNVHSYAIHWEIEFHPRDYWAKKTNSEAGANQVFKAREESPEIKTARGVDGKKA